MRYHLEQRAWGQFAGQILHLSLFSFFLVTQYLLMNNHKSAKYLSSKKELSS